MKSLRQRLLGLLAAAIAAIGLTAASPAQAASIGLLILEGSDSQTFHSLDPYSTNFLNGMSTFSSDTTLPIGIISSNPVGSPTVGKSAVLGSIPDLATLLASYSGIYIGSPGTCCSEYPITPAEAAIVRAFLEAGRSVAIEDYTGGANYDVVIGITGADTGTANAHVAGHEGGAPGLGDCFDGNVVAPGGSALFGGVPVGSAIPNLSCFGHQAYEEAFFDKYGLTTYIATNPGLDGFNVVISNGGGGLIEVVTGVPEPATMAVLGAAVIGLAGLRRRA